MTDRAGLADFLRRRRELLRPADVGLPEGMRRRAAGLRREEVAQLAGMSSDYYARIEQRRGPHPSESIVSALAIALRCDLDERDHMFHLAGLTPPSRRAGRHIRPGLISLADRLTDVPVCICTDVDEALWQNRLADCVLGPMPPRAGRSRNFCWRWFTDPAVRGRCPEEDWPRHSTAHVRDLRATYSRRGADPDVAALVHDLNESSAEFRALWEKHEVSVRRSDRKSVLHPEVGVLHLNCEVLLTPEDDLKVLALFPAEGTDARDKLELLRVIGSEDFQSAT
ncbi:MULTISPECIES: helix-turn-helix transcriptional regulator [unclassified Streptomyces]|uniref:helix-turn-helix transcriptional regulator n=1 Tax=unclassified Streptomyces TaxID=2593676 RepID=UPI002DDA3982|nr:MULTISPECIES: helix-turn-helix transcriptional regulator [unclassified Streptomyces]WSA96465.1 helix-turn-helix transcriptional regulator [Streptomyces sp. NBC_01795]WSB80877.1 helix-turn-helix transcriptional regulator [Streptomyces sp. NBC_01775]WSS10911.1 helix-turn-helix transcriptional regulator [Streptomyces sp. NBC_01186]WSS39608.1 helix-turn-helix transcriptional regulator [Streptomyces sp. NBC_01187]